MQNNQMYTTKSKQIPAYENQWLQLSYQAENRHWIKIDENKKKRLYNHTDVEATQISGLADDL